MPVEHRETVAEQGVEAVLLEVGVNHVELLRPLSPDTAVGKYLEQQRPGHAPRGVRDGRHRVGDGLGARPPGCS